MSVEWKWALWLRAWDQIGALASVRLWLHRGSEDYCNAV